jgi:hypothetical protein
MARIPIVPADLNLGSAPDDGTGSTLRAGGQVIRDWMADINAMTAELYAALPPWIWVAFGADNTRDRLTIATTGGLTIPDSRSFRAVIRFRPRENYSTSGTTNEELFSLSNGATNKLRMRRHAADKTIRFVGPLGGAVPSGATVTAIGEELLIVVEVDSLRGTQTVTLYVDGVLAETITANSYPSAATVDYATSTSLAIGGLNDGETNAATAFCRGDISELRLWFSEGATAIELCQPHETKAEVTVKGSSTSYTLVTTDRLWIGAVIYSDSAAGSATVTNIVGDVVTTGSWTGTEPLAAESVFWTTATPAHISDLLNNVRPPSNGAIAGIAPEVYFGGPGATVDDWNAGLNRGTLSAWTGGTVT